MRYPKHHKEETRRRLLERGGSYAKKHGFGGSGMDAMAAAAGVTVGSLYRHFDGKSNLFAAVVQAELKRTADMYEAIAADDAGTATRSNAAYLGAKHVNHPEHGCMLPSLTPEVARADDSVRAAFEAGLLEILASVERLTGSRDKAWALIAQNVGAVMIGRAILNERVRKELLSAASHKGQALLSNPVEGGRGG